MKQIDRDIMIVGVCYARKEWHISLANDHNRHRHYPYCLNECYCCCCHQKDYRFFFCCSMRFICHRSYLCLCVYWRLLVKLYKQVISHLLLIVIVDNKQKCITKKKRIRILSLLLYCLVDMRRTYSTQIINERYVKWMRKKNRNLIFVVYTYL